MGGTADWRKGGRSGHAWRVGVAVVLSAMAPFRLSAQVGHDPAHSPYHDIQRGVVLRFETGYLGGGRGRVPVGASGGYTFGMRFEAPLSRVLTLSAGVAYAQTERLVAFPTDSAAKRLRGPVDNDLILADLGFHLGLTGAKTFHGFQPYLSGALGIAAGSTLPGDSSEFQMGTKLSLTGGAGLRWYPVRRLSLQGEVRAVYWKLSYPLSFKELSADDGTRLLPLDAPLTDGVTHSWLSVGIGWTF